MWNLSAFSLQTFSVSLKNVAITASQLDKALNNDCMFDGSAIEGFVRIEESDMYLHPDLDTFDDFPVASSAGKGSKADLRCIQSGWNSL